MSETFNAVRTSQVPVPDHSNRIKILFYNKVWNYDFPDLSQLGYHDIHFMYEKEDIQDADVVVFHIPSLEVVPQELKMLSRPCGQLWIYWSYECEVHYPEWQRPDILQLFDLMATYRLSDDISLPYISQNQEASFRKAPGGKSRFANAFFSSRWDKSGRYDLLHQLMIRLPVHSFGKVLNNRSLENDPYATGGLGPDSFQFKERVISEYKFTLAFENAIAVDYVTEKFFQPLIIGSVPVYLGAPNVEDFAPGDNCYIDANSFSSIGDLADYLVMLDQHDELYNQYLNWKNQPFRSEFLRRLNMTTDGIQKMVSVVRNRLDR